MLNETENIIPKEIERDIENSAQFNFTLGDQDVISRVAIDAAKPSETTGQSTRAAVNTLGLSFTQSADKSRGSLLLSNPYTPAAIQVYYFCPGGRADCIYYALDFGNVPYDDIRISRDLWPMYKKCAPNGTVPFMAVNQCLIPETICGLIYAASKAGLMPDTASDLLVARSLYSEVFAIAEDVIDSVYRKGLVGSELNDTHIRARAKLAAFDRRLATLQPNRRKPKSALACGYTFADCAIAAVYNMLVANPNGTLHVPDVRIRSVARMRKIWERMNAHAATRDPSTRVILQATENDVHTLPPMRAQPYTSSDEIVPRYLLGNDSPIGAESPNEHQRELSSGDEAGGSIELPLDYSGKNFRGENLPMLQLSDPIQAKVYHAIGATPLEAYLVTLALESLSRFLPTSKYSVHRENMLHADLDRITSDAGVPKNAPSYYWVNGHMFQGLRSAISFVEMVGHLHGEVWNSKDPVCVSFSEMLLVFISNCVSLDIAKNRGGRYPTRATVASIAADIKAIDQCITDWGINEKSVPIPCMIQAAHKLALRISHQDLNPHSLTALGKLSQQVNDCAACESFNRSIDELPQLIFQD